MPKRRRTLGTEDGCPEEPESSSIIRKRRLRHTDSCENFQELYDVIRNHRTDEGRLVCDMFIRAPKKRTSADYYEVVSNPMDLLKIQQKLKADEYSDLEQLTRDFELLVTNAKTFYKRSTQEHRDACTLWELFCETKQRMANEAANRDDDSRSTDGGEKNFESLAAARLVKTVIQDCHDDDESMMEELFAAVMTAADTEGRYLSSMFQLLPSKSRYPDYYKVIHEPIDLKTIATRIQASQYSTSNELEKDLLLLVKNAKIYNEPGSQIYKDAAQLRKMIMNKKAELDQRKLTPAKTSERIRAKRMAQGQKWSAITAALRYESDTEEPSPDVPASTAAPPVHQPVHGRVTPQQLQDQSSFHCEETEDHNDSGPEDAAVNPQWQLYEAVKSYQSPVGYFVSEPFLRLPSRKLYPDYFREIKHPMSLFKICGRIKGAQYGSTMEVVDDLNIMFENAKRYNRPDSKIFKDAVKLQKVMQAKARELINYDMKQESESEVENGPDEEEVSRSSSSGGGVSRRGLKPKKLSLGGTPLTPSEAKKYKKTTDFEVSLRKRLKILYKSLVDYTDEYNRPLIPIFMEKPSAKDYPDYYEIISNPIDMKMIDWNIKNDKYGSEDHLVADLRLMFSNCRQYNEEGSQIYRDASTLERALLLKLKELGPLFDSRGSSFASSTPPSSLSSFTPGPGRPPGKRGPHRRLTDLQYKLRTLHESIRDYTDVKGRKLSTIFHKLPTKTDYPDYYEVIKRPMDLEKIGSKTRTSQYESLEDMLTDFILMFDNACKYNEPDSQIYKDALSLQRIALQTKLELNDPEDGVPDVRALIQELLTNLFTSVYNHQDEEGRCFSDSVVELAEADPANSDPNNPQSPLTLDIIKRNLNRGCYRRLDHFQEDMFEVFERARMVTRTDSQAFEDSIELQSFLVRKRDELCKAGSVLQSPALLYSEADLQASVESLRAQKLPCETQQEADFENQPDKEEKEDSEVSSSAADTVMHRGQTYHIGDFVYIEPREKGMEPHIIHIEKLWRDEAGDQWISGCWFYRPLETFHLATRKFLQKEVFKSDNYNSTPLSQVIGKCYVMCVKDYFKFKPEGFDDRDVYVCESRYSARCKSFKKIKIWGCFLNNGNSEIVPREDSLIPIRVPSAFKDGVEKHRDDSMDFDDGEVTIIEKTKPNIVCDVETPVDGATYYEQFNLPIGLYKLGDYCFIRTESDKTLISRIDRMWTDRMGNALFHGPWFLTPGELSPSSTPRLFYKQELFMSCVEDTNPLLSVVGRCAVVDLKDYATCRPTEIPEEDVFICEAKYMEAERQTRKFPKGLKKFQLSADVCQDEVYFFRNPVYPQKSEVYNTSVGICRPGLFTPAVVETENEESNDMPPPNLPGGTEATLLGTPLSTGKKKGSGKRLVTGYILFASEVRKAVVVANPDRTFGDISRMIGTEWRNLPPTKKVDYEERAQKQNEDMASREASLLLSGVGVSGGWDSYPHSPASLHGGSNNSNSNQGPGSQNDSAKEGDATQLWECLWDGCDYQFEELQDLLEHLLVENKGHIFQTYTNPKGGEYQCLWQNCARIKRNVPPFPNIQRLLRHCKEVHIKSASRNIMPEARSRNYVANSKNALSPVHTSNSNSASLQLSQLSSRSCSSPNPSSLTLTSGQKGYGNTPLQLSTLFQQLNSGTNGALPSTGPPVAHIAGYTPVKAPDPIFVATPPKPQRLLHSNTYIRYIEGLNAENRWVGDWDQQLGARKENTPLPSDPPSLQRLPSHWLPAGATAHHGDTLSALWALRDFMLRDALGIAKIAS